MSGPKEFGVDPELLKKQMHWLATEAPDGDEKEGLLNMLGDLADLLEEGGADVRISVRREKP